MSLLYEAAYRLGCTPWESHPHVDRLVTAGLDREERDGRPRRRTALDVGCGTGRWTVELARRGWEAVGVDDVAVALRRARRRAAAAGVGARFVRDDVTALRPGGLASGARLVLDVGCFDTLSAPRRAAMGASVTAATAAGATMLAVVWAPPQGVSSRDDLRLAYPAWGLVDEDVVGDGPRLLRLRRR